MPPQPLTHHEILTLIEPFARKGRHADLAASNRLERRLVFRPIEHGAATPGAPVLCETLQLENPAGDIYRLTRTLGCATGPNERLEARLVAEGKQPSGLLAGVEQIAPASQFRFGPGFATARSFSLSPGAAPDASAARMTLTGVAAAVGGLTVTFTAPTVKGYHTGDLALAARDGGALAFPDDLLAVLGRDWGLLDHVRNGWKSTLRLRGGEPERSLGAAQKLDRMVEHLATILAEAPARFHERHAGARWRVALHRATPLLLYIALIGAALSAATLNFQADSPFRMLIFNAAPVLVVVIYSLGKRPRIEIPPLPRRSTLADWREPPPDAAPAPHSLRPG